MGEGRGVCRVLVGKPEGNRPLGRQRRRWEDYIKMDFEEVVCWSFMEPERSLPHSKVPTTCLYLCQLKPVLTLISHYLNMRLKIIITFTPLSTKWSLSHRVFQQIVPTYKEKYIYNFTNY
jgi:hypothetical protein